MFRTFVLALALFLATPAFAAPQQSYSLTLTAGEISYIAGLLREQPYKNVADLLNKVQNQINAADIDALKDHSKTVPMPPKEPKK